jgi:uncharacterized glyoxalase superfamily protein PhnB
MTGGEAVISHPPKGMQGITPYLLYGDLGAAVAWITAAFGLSERSRMNGPDGKPRHVVHIWAFGLVSATSEHTRVR